MSLLKLNLFTQKSGVSGLVYLFQGSERGCRWFFNNSAQFVHPQLLIVNERINAVGFC